MGEYTDFLSIKRHTKGGSHGRLTRDEFSNLLRPHLEDIVAVREGLQEIKCLFCSGDRILPSEFENTIQYLKRTCEHQREFYALIESSEFVPTSVVPLRLPLMIALMDMEVQITKLNELLDMLCSDGWRTLQQPAERLIEIRKAIKTLISEVDEVSHQINILLDRARFKEREYYRLQGSYRK